MRFAPARLRSLPKSIQFCLDRYQSCGQRGREEETITRISLRVGPKGVRRVKDLWPHWWCTSMTVNQRTRVCRNAISWQLMCAVNPPRTEQRRHFRRSVRSVRLHLSRVFQTPQKKSFLCKDRTCTCTESSSSANAQTQTCLKDARRPAVTADWISFLRTPLIPLWIFSY